MASRNKTLKLLMLISFLSLQIYAKHPFDTAYLETLHLWLGHKGHRMSQFK